MAAIVGRIVVVLGLALLAVPAAAGAQPAWSCSAGTGWVAANGQRSDAPGVGGLPCPTTQADAPAASGGAGSLSATGTISAVGGGPSQTVDTRTPSAAFDGKSVAIRSADGKLVLTATGVLARASASCDANRVPTFTSEGGPGTVVLNGRTIDSGHEYSEPGVGVNGAPLFGRILIRFNEVAKSDSAITRRAIHLSVTDRDGAVLFEAVAGEVTVGRDGAVCDPPPLCPPGQEAQAGRCVDVDVTPLPDPPAPVAPLPPGTVPPASTPGPGPSPAPSACADADARARQVSTRRLARATLCLMNVERSKRRLPKLRMSTTLGRAASRHVRDMVARRYFSHTQPGGAQVLDRILRSGYLKRYGRWRVGENLGWGWGGGATPRAIVRAWMRSRPHRHNILNRRFRDVGIAVRIGSPRQRRAGSITYVIDFGGFQATRARA
jgi:uncharacterized protein YkwD